MSEEDLAELEEYWAKKEKKLRKILGDDNFEIWYSLHPEEFGLVEPTINEEQKGNPGKPEII